MSTDAPPRYVVWRVADCASYGGAVHANKPDGRPSLKHDRSKPHPWQKDMCSECGEPVWHQPAHREGRVLVCWGCAE